MFDLRLFLGMSVTPLLECELKKVNPSLLSLFTSGGLYLEKLNQEKQLFLGKYTSKDPNLSELVQLEANVKSLLKKLFPKQQDSELDPRLVSTNMHRETEK